MWMLEGRIWRNWEVSRIGVQNVKSIKNYVKKNVTISAFGFHQNVTILAFGFVT